MIQITQYWNKVEKDETGPFGTKVIKGEYVIKKQWRDSATFNELKERWKNCERIIIEPDKITEDNGSYYGIHGYTVIIPI